MLLARALQASGDGLSGAGRWRKGGACVLLTPVTVPHSPQNRRITPLPTAPTTDEHLKARRNHLLSTMQRRLGPEPPVWTAPRTEGPRARMQQ